VILKVIISVKELFIETPFTVTLYVCENSADADADIRRSMFEVSPELSHRTYGS